MERHRHGIGGKEQLNLHHLFSHFWGGLTPCQVEGITQQQQPAGIWVFHSLRQCWVANQPKGNQWMKKKAARKLKGSAAKLNKNSGLLSASTSFESKPRSSRPMKLTDDPRFAQAVQNYEAGLKALQAHKYDRAKTLFEKVV